MSPTHLLFDSVRTVVDKQTQRNPLEIDIMSTNKQKPNLNLLNGIAALAPPKEFKTLDNSKEKE